MGLEELRREKLRVWQEYQAAILPFQYKFEQDTAPFWEAYLKAEAAVLAKFTEIRKEERV